MPTKFADFFSRTIEQVSTQGLCEWLQISSNYLGVILHRVRSALRLCLEKRRFKSEKVGCTDTDGERPLTNQLTISQQKRVTNRRHSRLTSSRVQFPDSCLR